MERHLRFFWFVLIICIIIPVCILLGKFLGYPISPNIQMWGAFGDYVAGIIGTTISLANLYVFVRLTILVANNQEETSNQSIRSQNRILLSQLRQDSVSEISKWLNTLGQNINTANATPIWEVLKLEQALDTFCNNYTHLFFDLECNNLKQEITTLKGVITTMPYSQQAFSNSFGIYLREKDLFIQKLHRQIINGVNE